MILLKLLTSLSGTSETVYFTMAHLNMKVRKGACQDVERTRRVTEELCRSCTKANLVCLQTLPNCHWKSSTPAPAEIVEPGRPIVSPPGRSRLNTSETRRHFEAYEASGIPGL